MVIFRLLIKEFIFVINFNNYKGFGFFILAINSELGKDFIGKYIAGVFNAVLKKENNYINNGLSAADFGKYAAIFADKIGIFIFKLFGINFTNYINLAD